MKLISNTIGRFRRPNDSPWWWIPSLYFAEGLPYFAVNSLSLLIYSRLGVDLATLTFVTSLLSLPWAIKPLWAPFVDIIGSKRQWILGMQAAIAVTFIAIMLLLPIGNFFALSFGVFLIMGFLSATHDVAADGYYMLALDTHRQASYSGLRNTFYRIANLFTQGALVCLAGFLFDYGYSVRSSWMVVFGLLAIIFLSLSLYHRFAMPRANQDKHRSSKTAREILIEFGGTIVTFFRKKDILVALLFILFYRFPEALLTKVVTPFLVAKRAEGGLELTDTALGIVNGTVGVIALLAGGILGGICIARGGLKKWLWWMALSLTIPSGFYCYLAMAQPTNLALICTGIGIEQFGYGFGFTAFMLYLIYFSDGPYKTSHYAFCTGFMTVGMMLPGMVSGLIQQWLSSLSIFHTASGTNGYTNFFWFVMLTCILTFAVCALIRIPKEFGKKSYKRDE